MATDIISATQAREQGLTRYFTGIACRAGHVSERRVSGRVCCECYRHHFAKRREDHQRETQLPTGMVIGLKEARLAGFSHYFTGVPCKRGHVEKRHTSNGTCLQCDVEKHRAAQWHVLNRDQHNANSRKWTESNREKARGAGRTSEHKRRAQKAGSGGTHTAADLAEILNAQGHRCAYCRADLRAATKHVDHIKPLARGGSNGRSNLQYLCRPCNQSKSARDPIAFAQSRGLLL